MSKGYPRVESEKFPEVADALTKSLAKDGWDCEAGGRSAVRCERNADLDAIQEVWQSEMICKGHLEYQYVAYYTKGERNSPTKQYGMLRFQVGGPPISDTFDLQ